MAGSLRIGGALLLAILIVGLSLVARGNQNATATESGELIVTPATRTYIEPIDSNGDGVSDWEESLTARVFDAIATPTSTEMESGESYETPATLTGKFSEAFLQDYLNGKMAGKDFEADSKEFINKAVSAIGTAAKSKPYTPIDVSVIPDTDEAIREYGNNIGHSVGKASLRGKVTGSSLEILSQALQQNNPTLLEELDSMYSAYSATMDSLLDVSVPQSFLFHHLSLLNSLESLRLDIRAMRTAFDDPLLALARINEYENDRTASRNSFLSLNALLKENGVAYAKDEPGAFFYLFEQ